MEITASKLWEVLENGVSQWPKHEGRFPIISGFSFSFNPKNKPGYRILEISVDGKPIDEKKIYTIASKPYISIFGKDGYDCFIGTKLITPLEECIINSVSLYNYLETLSIVRLWNKNFESINIPENLASSLERKKINEDQKPHFKDLIKKIVENLDHEDNLYKLALINPQIEGRIKNFNGISDTSAEDLE